ncbi:programmed cell death 1 ligand 1-like isoform X2 [Myripristis murdjan]|uniref:programmed cell death 1 ligand 1-like isoform X2 n=1 Tax=Myripristis murdjan TaxID=586833 RepID=UPI001176458E|nr:programmed cell death 1 ligand 1-like isoform X2 [Myripristis murdjan]
MWTFLKANSREEMISFLLLVVLTASVCGQLQVNVSQPVYQAEENSNITMEWTFTPIMPPVDYILYISLSESEYEPLTTVYYLLSGADHSKARDERFRGRVQLDKDELIKGTIRLHLSSLTTNDSGTYWCVVLNKDGGSMNKSSLNVTAVTPRPEEPEPTKSL